MQKHVIVVIVIAYDKYLAQLLKWQADQNKIDRIFITQHFACITLGVNASTADILPNNTLPVFQSTRAGGATYHDEGQLMLYPMINLKKNKISAINFIQIMHQWAIAALSKHNIAAFDNNEPGLWNDMQEKIAFMGLAIKNGATEHGMAFNLNNCNIANFQKIIPCRKKQPIGMIDITFSELFNALEATSPFAAKLQLLDEATIQQ